MQSAASEQLTEPRPVFRAASWWEVLKEAPPGARLWKSIVRSKHLAASSLCIERAARHSCELPAWFQPYFTPAPVHLSWGVPENSAEECPGKRRQPVRLESSRGPTAADWYVLHGSCILPAPQRLMRPITRPNHDGWLRVALAENRTASLNPQNQKAAALFFSASLLKDF